MRKKIKPVSNKNAQHYLWGNNCDGWHLVKSDELSIIQERMPPGTAEVRHYHERSRQFFFILSGTALLEADGEEHILKTHEGLEIPPMVTHKIQNNSDAELNFIVVSQPKSHGDRVVVEE